jgi:PAS domain S-box-containing protein
MNAPTRANDELAALKAKLNQLEQQLQQEIAAHRETQALLQQNTVWQQFITQISLIGFYRADASGKIIFASEYAYQIIGLTPADMLGEAWLEQVHPDDQTHARQSWQQAIAARQPYQGEYRLVGLDGRITWVLDQATPEPSDTPAQAGFIGIITDITQRKETEEALRQSEHQLRLVADNLPAFIAYANADDLRYHFVNRMYEVSFDQPRHQLIGQSLPEVVGESSYQFAQKYLEEVRAGRPAAYENTFDLAQGKRWVKVNYVPDFDDQGQVRGIVVLSYDITEQKQAQETLARLNRQQQLILDSVGEGILGLDAQGRITFANAAAARLTGWSVNAMLGQNSHHLLHHSTGNGQLYPPEACPVCQTFQTGIPQHISTEMFWRRDGGSFPVEYLSAPLYEGDNLAGAVVTFQDITARKQREENLEVLLRQLQQPQTSEITTANVLTMCGWCHRRIRNEQGQWLTTETYLKTYLGRQISHGICPNCQQEIEAEWLEKKS